MINKSKKSKRSCSGNFRFKNPLPSKKSGFFHFSRIFTYRRPLKQDLYEFQGDGFHENPEDDGEFFICRGGHLHVIKCPGKFYTQVY